MTTGAPGTTGGRYDAFISYGHESDHLTAAALQRALQRLGAPWYRLRNMRVFRDETDLSVAPEGWALIESALDDSRFLILLASRNAADSPWVAREVSHWLDRRGPGSVLIALSDGEIAWDDEAADFDWTVTSAIPRDLTRRFPGEPFWVDLRAVIQDGRLSLRDPGFQRSVAKLAAPIHGVEMERLVSEDRRQHRNRLRTAGAAATGLLALAVAALWQFQEQRAASARATEQTVIASISEAYRVLNTDPLQAADAALRGLDLNSTPEGGEVLRTNMAVALQRLQNLRDESQVLGSGDGYLMERWRQGSVYSRMRRDGRYTLVATERGANGPNPPGTVYLVNLDSLRTVALEAGKQANGRRLEYMGFSNDGTQVFVARQFYLDIFDLTGARTASVQLEYHAKPTHLIAGMFGKYVLVGDTVGHLMLADTTSGDRPQLEGGRRHRDAALLIESNMDGTRAVVIFESGRAYLVVLEDPEAPLQLELEAGRVVFAAFARQPGTGRFLTWGADGSLQVFREDGGAVRRLASLPHEAAPFGYATFSSDGARVISMDDKGILRRWEIATASLLSAHPLEDQ